GYHRAAVLSDAAAHDDIHLHEHDHPHDHDHDHPHDHSHDHDYVHDHAHPHDHQHGPGGHTHAVPPGAAPRALLARGVSGGIVPCPEALIILILAIHASQIGYGLLLISSFSIGLAAVLILIGVLMVRARGLLDRVLPGGRWIYALPIVSAVVVTVIGLALSISTVVGQKWA